MIADPYTLYDKRGDLLEELALSEIRGTKFYLQPELDKVQKEIAQMEAELKRDLNWLGGPQSISLDKLPGLLFAVALAFNASDEWMRKCEAQILAEEAALGSAQSGSGPEWGGDAWFAGIDEIPF